MKLHNLTSAFLVITIVLVVLNVYFLIRHESWKKGRYNYSVDVGVANHHPINGKFTVTTKNGEEFPFYNNNDFGYWGYGRSSDYKYLHLPQTLSAHWVALRERKIYKGTFEFPHQKIDSLLKIAYPDKSKFNSYYSFIVGIEPDGYITLWMSKHYKYQKEIARFKADTTNQYYNFNTTKKSMDELTTGFLLSSESIYLDSIFKHKIPADTEKWKNLAKKYKYYLKFENFPTNMTTMDIGFFNKEKDEFFIKNGAKHLINSGVPSYLRTNKFENNKDIRLKLSEELMNNFKERQSALKSNDTLVFLVKYDTSQKSMHAALTTVNEINH